MKRILNKWQSNFKIGKNWTRDPISQTGWHKVDFYIVKITKLQEEGCVLEKRHYKGFWLTFYFWFPIDF